MRPLGTFLVLMVFTLYGCAPDSETPELRVLYVGVNPETAELSESEKIGVLHTERLLEFKQARTASFERFLQAHFAAVDVVFADEYNESLSDNYDVTIFGDNIKPSKETVSKQNEDGSRQFEMPVYLSAEFDRPAILVSMMGPLVAEPLDYKMDWLCYCLDAYAHNVKQDHPIFSEPVKVDLTFSEQPTPENYLNYYNGRNLPDTLPMWRVQTEGYMQGNGFPIGMVSSGGAFEDAPDSEVISGGINTKPVNAAAISRHGNFLHWGFAASPDEMTEEARQVFVNAIHYIARFDGNKPYSRRALRTLTRDLALDQGFRAADVEKSYAGHVDFIEELNERETTLLTKRQEAGVKLTFSERRFLANGGYEIPTLDDYVEQRILDRLPEELVDRFGMDLGRYLDYYEENVEFLVPDSSPYQYVVDPDAAALGVSNRQTEILDRAISLLEHDPTDPRARRLLARYTAASLETPAEWREWFAANVDRMYFAELNGQKFRLIPDDVN
ncbi:MAG: hypothetical protein OEY37_04105 [Gammaproteobacteria bacterium]|nr:hypothetical protein [Gammaproteobacteria bacterium]